MPDNLDDLRHIEGFPIGEDEDLLALSDPPYYTAYPNPHIAEFIQKWGKPYPPEEDLRNEASDDYHREPFVGDVSEGKSDPIYQAHAYHTKVPYKAISRFITHYTDPNDIVLDAFCGSGMTGIAAQIEGRRAILGDLSPAATFIASCYNNPIDEAGFISKSNQLLKAIQTECGWMYETRHVDGRKGKINFTVWSDIHRCPYCQAEHVLWYIAVDVTTKTVSDDFRCTECGARLHKKLMPKVLDSEGQAKTAPVLINYSLGRNHYEKTPDEFDLQLIERIENSEIPYWCPTERMMFIGERWGDMYVPLHHEGISRVDQFYTKRNLWVLATLFNRINSIAQDNSRLRNPLLMLFTSVCISLTSKLTRYNFGRRGNGYLSGTLYIPSYVAETRVDKVLRTKIRDLSRIHQRRERQPTLITTQSSTDLSNIPSDSIDYVFVDPPFGRNLMYSELNFLWEAWLRVFTRNEPEAIVNKSQNKRLEEYRGLMQGCFSEMYRVLKPNRWITVEFHNSKAAIWNAIQDALSRAGFVVAQVAALDKKQGSYKQVTEVGAVKNDLVINAYKPRTTFSRSFVSRGGQGLEVDFIRQHLARLPIAGNVERSKEMLYSKYLAYYVQHGYQVAYNSQQFYQALPQWGFVERDGYWFADEAQEYEKRKVGARKDAPQRQAALFIIDERSARQWLWDFLETPRTYDQIYTAFVKALQTPEDQLPEPMTMLEEGFVRTNGQWKRPDALTQAELEERRHARLLRQFGEYLEAAQAGGRLKEVRKEAVLAGFTEAYRSGRFQDILAVGRRLPKKLVESSADLFDFIDIAEAKVET
jgi:DNA modification methylase